jgi:hypothetical protein
MKLKIIKKREATDLARSRKDVADAAVAMDISERKAHAGDVLEASLLTGHKVHFGKMVVRLENATQTLQGMIMSINPYRLPRADATEMKGEQADCYVTDSEDDDDDDDDDGRAREADSSVAQADAEHDDSKPNHHKTAKRGRDDSNSGAESDEEPSVKKAK